MNRLLTLTLASALLSGCAFTTRAADTNGMTDNNGKAFTHQSTSIVALHWLFGAAGPLVQDASLENTVATFTADAKAAGDSEARIVQSDKTVWWWVFPPLSFIVTPVTSEVAGDTRP